MSSVWKDKSFKQPCILTCFVGWTKLWNAVIFWLQEFQQIQRWFSFTYPITHPLGGKNEPTRRMCWKQFFLMPLWHIPKTLSFHVTWVEVKPWALKNLCSSRRSPPTPIKSTRPKRNINTFCEAAVCTPFLQLHDFYSVNLKWLEEGARLPEWR